MTKRIAAFLLPLYLAGSAACGNGGKDSDFGADADPNSVADAGNAEALVNGIPASEFYGQFVWEVSDGALSGATSFPESGGYDAYKYDVFLREDQSYTLFYGEGSGTVSPTGASLNLDTTTFTRFEGDWRVDGTELVLAPYLRCSGLRLNDSDVVSCALTQPAVTAAAVGSQGIARLSVPSSPFDSEWSDYQ